MYPLLSAKVWRQEKNKERQNKSIKRYRKYRNIEKKVVVTFRSSRLEVLCKKGVLRNFAKFTGNHLLIYSKRDSGTGVFQ